MELVPLPAAASLQLEMVSPEPEWVLVPGQLGVVRPLLHLPHHLTALLRNRTIHPLVLDIRIQANKLRQSNQLHQNLHKLVRSVVVLVVVPMVVALLVVL
jgi:hypothetical protein